MYADVPCTWWLFVSVCQQSVLLNPLPPKLVKAAEVTRDEHFITTAGSAHDNKHAGLVYGNQDPLYKKAPAHWKVDYNKDLHEKVCYHFNVYYAIKLVNFLTLTLDLPKITNDTEQHSNVGTSTSKHFVDVS